MREHDTLGIAGAAAAEDNGGKVVYRHTFTLSARSFDDRNRSQQCEDRGGGFLRATDGVCNILEPENRWPVREVELGLCHELTACHDRVNLGLAHRRFHTMFADGVVEVYAGTTS